MKKYYSYPKFILFTLILGIISCDFESDDADSHDNNIELSESSVFYDVEVPSWLAPGNDPAVQADLALLPTVSAGERQFSDPNVIVVLKGKAGGTKGATIEQVYWQQVSGSKVAITEPTTLETAIVVPDLEQEEEMGFRLNVLDSNGNINFSTTFLHVRPSSAFARVVGLAVPEGQGSLQFKVRLSAAQDDDILVNYRTQDGTAVAGIDYVQTSGSVLIAAGEREVLITVPLLSGNILAGGETFGLQAILALSDGTYTSNVGLALVQRSPDVPPEPGLPVLVDAPAQTLTVDIAVVPIALTNTGGGQLTACRAQTTLPTGLILTISEDGTTCELSGTPTAVQAQAEYSLTATNTTGSSNALVTIAVNTLPSAPILENAAQQTYTLNGTITPLRLANNGGGELTSCGADSLPEGLQVRVSADATSCEITGAPTSAQVATVHTITAINTSVHSETTGNSATVEITVVIPAESTPFITRWKTDNPGVSADNQILISTSPNFTYNYQVSWGDGSTDSNVTGDITHTYAEVGIYTIEITEVFPQIYFQGQDADKLLSVEQWGNQQWLSMENAFRGFNNLTLNATDAPDLSLVKSMAYMFARVERVSSFDSDISNWDVSSVTNMKSMFWTTSNVNPKIGDWDVSSVTNMEDMFLGAVDFNQDIADWDVSSVTNMANMFVSADAFNGNLSAWNVASVKNMQSMFSFSSFDGDISNWDVSSVTNMSRMFAYSIFNQDLTNWNVSSVTNMSYMFEEASDFNSDISGWDVSSVTDMYNMFANAYAFNQDISSWDVTSVLTMGGIFTNLTLSPAMYDALLISWASQNLQNDIRFDGGYSQYSNEAQSARDQLTETFNWSISDGGPIE